MAENKREASAAARSSDPRASRSQQRHRQRSVFQYITILFAAALVLLLYTFMMERRQFELQKEQDRANISDLQKQSTSAVQRLEQLIAENDALKDQLEEEKAQLDALQDRHDQLEADYNLSEQANISLEQETEALEHLCLLERAYSQKKYNQCREIIQQMGEQLPNYLPPASALGEDQPSPAARYQEIYDKVMK
ncbi:MAG: hypothetical protein HFF58_03760 [Lawsonibacter sp.]|jgi:chromosome segregation ATPase|nr:hypothetical protein [Lawsonibacter sp.]